MPGVPIQCRTLRTRVRISHSWHDGNYLAYFLGLAGVDKPFVITVISMVVCLLIVGLLGFFGVGSLWNSRTLSAFCIIWSAFYYIYLGAVGWAIVGEISSSRLRAKTTSIAAITSSMLNMAWSIAIPYLVNAENANLGAKTGIIFFGFGFILAIVCFFCMPETKAKSFDELDALFEARTPARKF